MHQNANKNFVHSELVQVFYDIKWISSGALNLKKKKKKKKSIKIDPGTQNKTWYVK